MSSEHGQFRLGVMLLVINEKGQVLLGKRKNAFAAGEYGIPSGHMDSGETFLQTAVRELNEETGIKIDESQLVLFAVSNYIVVDWTDQYVTFDFLIHISDSEIIKHEPDKCEGWDWYDLAALPSPLHYPAERTIAQYQNYLIKKTLILS